MVVARPLEAMWGAVDGCRDKTAVEGVRVDLDRGRQQARAWAAIVPNDARRGWAAAFAQRALVAFARAREPGLCLSAPSARAAGLDAAAGRLADALGRDVAGLPLIEAACFVTGLYPTMLPPDERGAAGAYYTPPALVARLLDQATEEGVDWRSARILDPAAGGGAFLVAAAVRMRQAMADAEPGFILAQIAHRLVGLEVDPHAAALAQGALEVALADLSAASARALPEIVRVCDTLDETPHPAFDLVVGNPPYGRVTLTAARRERYARSLYGHANLYGVFTDIALRWTKPGGLVAYVTPASFLAGQYYAALRDLLAREAPPVAIDFVQARRGVFEDVLQETLVAVYRKGAARQRARIHYLDVRNEREATVTRNGTIGLPADTRAPWLAPRDPADAILVARAEAMPARLADWGYAVSTGPLVWNRHKDQLQDTAGGPETHPLIWAEAVTGDGRFVFRAERRNHAPYFRLRPGDGWLRVDTPCVLVQRTTAKEQARRLIAAELTAAFVDRHRGVVVENHLNMVRPRGSAKVPPSVVAALLNSRVADAVFRCMSGSVAVSAFELEALPLPEAAHLAALTRLVAAGAARAAIEGECDRLYGVAA